MKTSVKIQLTDNVTFAECRGDESEIIFLIVKAMIRADTLKAMLKKAIEIEEEVPQVIKECIKKSSMTFKSEDDFKDFQRASMN